MSPGVARLVIVTQWFTESFRAEFDRQASLMGRFNLGVFGKTGVGKSTLINAVFGSEVARTGIGAPVTEGSHLYLDARGSLGLIDTRGLEIGRDDARIGKELTTWVTKQRKEPLHAQMHAAWYCVRAMDRRFEPSEARFIEALDGLGVPVILVFTQVPMFDGGFHPDAVELAREVVKLNPPIEGGRPVMTYALRDQFTGQPAHGLMDLMRVTFLAVPEIVHTALASAQQVDLAAKARQANKHIGSSVAAAGAAAAVPIPFSSAAVLVPLQLSMMARIAQLYAVPFDRAAILAIASTSVATSAGRNLVTNMLKMIPGAGSVAGGVINAGVASGLTLAMGQAWLVVCQKAAGGDLPTLDGIVDSQAIRDLFETEFLKRASLIRRPR